MADSLYDLAYPPELRNTEERLLGRAPRIGLAVSGGGIRSATFALGVFQALARLDLLRHLDCLSTVSGGSYFGAFFGRLFHRGYIQSHDDIRWVLTGPHNGQQPPRTHDPTLERAGWRVLDWLRENGRYLSPRGAGDLLIGGAVLLRNWVSLHVVLASFFLTMFLLLQLPRMVTFWSGGAAGPLATVANAVDTAMAWMPFASIWWSPWMLVALLAASMAVPPGWAYWIIRDERRFETGALVGAAVAMVFGGVLAIVGWSSSPISRDIGIAIVVFAASTLACYGLAMWRAGQRSQSADASQWQLQRTNAMRHNLSAWFKNVLIAAGIVAAFAIIDSLGQTTYRGFGTGLPAWFTGVGATIIGAAGFARQIVVLISPRANGKRAPLPLAVIATLVAILLAGIILIGVNATSHAIAWDFHQPPAHGPRPRADITVFLIWLLGMTAVILSVGQAFSFLNYSSYQSLYAARLTRAYLGASNEDRWLNQSRPVTEPIPGDDLDVHEYWPLAQASGDTSKSEGLYKRDQRARRCTSST